MLTADSRSGSKLAASASGASDPWQRILAAARTTSAALSARLGLPIEDSTELSRAEAFPVVAPEPFIRRMRYADPQDPLLLQVLARPVEMQQVAGFTANPVGECGTEPQPGLLHKYHGRVLLITTGSCAIHCRYCFRRHYPYQDTARRGRWWGAALQSIAADHTITEVILSGGDPLVLSNSVLSQLISEISEIAHIERLRIHSRLPIVIPQRVDEGLLAAFSRWSQHKSPIALVLHSNHPNEFADDVAQACSRLRAGGLVLLNQAVLLAGVNDSVSALADLSTIGYKHGVLPYYLHQLDRVSGSAHFAVDDSQAKSIHRQMQQRLPGFLVPKLVQEITGATSKEPL